MPRRGNVPKREVLPDPMYNSVLVTKLVNSVMLDGKKGVAQKVVYSAFDMIKDKTGNEPLDVFNQAMENIMPSLETKSRRVGGATYQYWRRFVSFSAAMVGLSVTNSWFHFSAAWRRISICCTVSQYLKVQCTS